MQCSDSLKSEVSPRINFNDIQHKSLRGGMVTLVSSSIVTTISFTAMVILARLLTPNDYGIMAMSMVVTGFSGLFRDMGLTTAIIQKQTLTHAQISNIFWINVGMGSLLTIVVAAVSPLVAWFYRKPELMPLILLLSVTFFTGSIGAQHVSLLQRDLRFQRTAIIGIGDALFFYVVSIILAFRGYGFWALGWGSIVSSTLTMILILLLSSFRPGLWTRGAGVRSLLKLGVHITLFDCINYMHRNFDKILIGKLKGADALGFYSRAYSLIMLPINTIFQPINSIALPAMSRLQNEPEMFRIYYRRFTAMVAFLSMPLYAILFVLAEPVIQLVLGPQWMETAILFQIFAIAALIQPSTNFLGTVILSMGFSKKFLTLELFRSGMTIIAFLIGIAWGGRGIALSYVITSYLIFPFIFYWVLKNTVITISDYFCSISKPLFASLFAVSFILLLENFFHLTLNLVIYIFLLVCVFSFVFLLVFFLIPGGFSEFRKFFRLREEIF